MRESAKDLFPADQVVGEVYRFGWTSVSLTRFELAEGGGLAKIRMPSAVNTASKEPVNWPARSLIRNLTGVERAAAKPLPGR